MGKNFLKSSLQNATFNIIHQLGFRVVTFLLNAFVLRNLSQAVIGVMNVRLLLLESTILFLSREAFRRACLSKTTEHYWPQVINLLWFTCGGLQKLKKMGRKVDVTPANGGSRGRADRLERESLVLWRRPMKTTAYFIKELMLKLASLFQSLCQYKRSLLGLGLILGLLLIASGVDGRHQEWLLRGRAKLWWSLYWLGLGVLSSIGLGTGLHTFLLYLGPHIASVTLAAYECGGLNFPQPPYPDDIICPDQVDPRWGVSIWNIMRKVALEAIMWGAGTALGELPPYFMARAARLSGVDPDDEEELKEFEDLQRKKEEHPEALDWLDRAKLLMEQLVNRVGFLGILVCASVPNPLFDLAGITCGHFLVPFWTFFGATLIGKAVIKMMIQAVFVIVAFSDTLISKLTLFLSSIPGLGNFLQSTLENMLRLQREKLHRDSSHQISSSKNPLATVFELFVLSMVAYFIVSIVNSFAQNYHKRLHKSSGNKKRAKD